MASAVPSTFLNDEFYLVADSSRPATVTGIRNGCAYATPAPGVPAYSLWATGTWTTLAVGASHVFSSPTLIGGDFIVSQIPAGS